MAIWLVRAGAHGRPSRRFPTSGRAAWGPLKRIWTLVQEE